MKKLFILLLFLAIGMLSFTQNVKGQTMIINELSNGSIGSQEFVEFLVTGSCGQTLDIRGWYYDDNCVSPGMSSGCGRFANIAQWAAVPVGSIIVIYNGGDPNTSMPAEDPTDANGDGVYIISSIIPSTGNVIEYQTTALTDCNASSYTATTGYATGVNSWAPVGLGNTADLFQIRNSSGVQQFSVGYGTTTTGCTIYFVGAGATRSYIFTGTAGSDPTNIANWTNASAATTQSPGRANNCDNAAFIEALLTVKDNEFKVAGCPNITATNTTLCVGATASKNLTGSVSGSYAWSTSDASVATVSGTGQNATITAVGAGTANIIVTVTHTYSNLYTGLTGCAATPIVKTMTYPVTVNASVTTLYVDASIAASGNGETWATAYKTLDEALAVAHCCSSIDTIKVAAGTYIPTKKPYNGCTEMTTADARDLTFHLPDGLVLWGGYPAGGGVRNIPANVTTLSGDFNSDDVVTGSGSTLSITDNTENAYHVVLASTGSGGVGVTIDGFTITGGNANNTTASYITVNGNTIFRHSGGGIYTYNGTNTLSNNTLSGNSASYYGGGILTYYGTNTLSNNTLSGNSAGYSGGGIYTFLGTTTLTNNTLSGNSATNGGGIYSAGDTNTLTNNTLSGNTAGSDGGGIYTNGGTNTITNNTLSGNSANRGGGILTFGGTNTLSNNTLSGNSANSGGGIYSTESTNTLSNNTLSGNSAGSNGGGIYITDFFGAATSNFKNNIFWGNQQGGNSNVAGADYFNQNATVTFTNNLLQLAASSYTGTNYSLGTASGNIFQQDPLFVDAADIDGADNIHRTADDGLQLSQCSPAINAGTNTGVAATDIIGATRIQQSIVDMGAYESAFSFSSFVATLTSNSPQCGTVTLTALPDNGINFATGYTYAWSAGATGSGTDNTATVTASGTYTVTVTDGATGCTATSSTSVVINAAPPIAITSTPSGCTTTVSALIAQKNAINFDGSNDYLDCGNNSNVQITGSAITLEAWIYPTSWRANAYQGCIINKEDTSGNGYMLRAGNSGVLNFNLGSGSWNELDASVTLSLNTWQHIAGTYDGTTMRLYINGAIVGTKTVSISIGNANVNLFIGSSASYTDRTFPGIIDEVRVWNVTRTQAEIQAAMNASVPTNSAGLRAYYKMDEGTGTTTADATGLNSPATLTNNPTWEVHSTAPIPTAAVPQYAWSNGAATRTTSVTGGVYTVTVTDAYGCSATSSVTVNSLTATLTSNSPQIGSVMLTATPYNGTNYTYAWSAGATGAGNNTATVTATGTYTVTITETATGCTATSSTSVVIMPCPSVVTLYVDASIAASGNGQTWATAYKTLDEALAVAHCCSIIDTIKVAEGTYLPTKKPYDGCTELTTTDARDVTFHLPDGLVLWGGYPAGGGVRNIPANVTTLSGDFNGDDVVTGSGSTLSITNNTENAYHVVLASAAISGGVGVTIDGFAITGGKADRTEPMSASKLNVNGNNIDRANGGGIYTYNGTNSLNNNTLSGNSALVFGGGIYIEGGTNTLINNTLSGNSANGGGGISAYDGTNTLTNNTLSGNTVTNNGGGIYTSYGTNTLTNNTLSGNTATNNGGGINTGRSTNILTNNTLSGNSAGSNGGGIYTADGTNTLSNNTLSGNSATNNGGGIFIISFSPTTTANFKNNIFWGNQQGGSSTAARADYYNLFATVTFTNNLMQLAASDYTAANSNDLGTATGNIFATDPLFVNAADIDGADNIHRTADDGLRLKPCSPAINAGNNTGVAATDITGAARIQQTTVDMGAYENKDLSGYTLDPSILTADAECTDGAGVTNYYNTTNNALLLSIQKNGNTIGTIGDGTFTVTSGGSGVSNLGTSGTPAPYATASNWHTMNRYWNVTPTTQPTSDVNVRFYYRPADYTDVQTASGIAAESNLVFYKINGTGNPDPTTAHSGTPATPATAYNSVGYWEYYNGASASGTNWASGTYNGNKYAETIVASFSGGGGGAGSGTGGGALPVELLSFSGKNIDGHNHLYWTTASEKNNKGFEVERSTNGRDWKNLGFEKGNGTTASGHDYTFIDENPALGINYYRLKQVDYDGAYEYSKTISMTNEKPGRPLHLYPNPTTNTLHFEGPMEGKYQIVNSLGQVQLQGNIQGNSIDISSLGNGQYLLQIVGENGTEAYAKFLKINEW